MCNISFWRYTKAARVRRATKTGAVPEDRISFLWKSSWTWNHVKISLKQGGLFSKDHVSGLVVSDREEVILPACINNMAKLSARMRCRAFLSPWYERGGMYPADDKDTPVFVGRFNIGAVSLHLPMILAKQEPRAEISMRCWISICRWSVICITVLMNIWDRCVLPRIRWHTVRAVSMADIWNRTKRSASFEADDSFLRYYSTEWTAGAL